MTNVVKLLYQFVKSIWLIKMFQQFNILVVVMNVSYKNDINMYILDL